MTNQQLLDQLKTERIRGLSMLHDAQQKLEALSREVAHIEWGINLLEGIIQAEAAPEPPGEKKKK